MGECSCLELVVRSCYAGVRVSTGRVRRGLLREGGRESRVERPASLRAYPDWRGMPPYGRRDYESTIRPDRNGIRVKSSPSWPFPIREIIEERSKRDRSYSE